MPTQPSYSDIKRARILRASGYSDNDLMEAGFDSTVISRAFVAVSERNAVKIRCKECGRLFFRVNRAGHCLACEMVQNSPRLELVKSSVLPKKNSHPDILS